MDDRPMSPLAAEIAMLRRLAAVEAKLAAAEAKVAQCREVLREREFVGGVKGWVCPDCGDYGFTYRVDEKWVHEPHRPDCAWKRAMEDA